MRTNTEHPHTTSEPSTGNGYLDKFIDELPVDAKAALLALLERHGQDDCVDLARRRLESQMDRFRDPVALDQFCRLLDDSSLEERVTFWLVFRDGWQHAVS